MNGKGAQYIGNIILFDPVTKDAQVTVPMLFGLRPILAVAWVNRDSDLVNIPAPRAGDRVMVFFDGGDIGNQAYWYAVYTGSIEGGAIKLGEGETSFNVDPNGNVWVGASEFDDAPFQLTAGGALTVEGALITSSMFTAGSIQIGDTTGLRVDALGNMWVGADEFDNAPFKVTASGALTALSGAFGGSITIGTDAESFHVDSLGNMWIGAVEFEDAQFRVTNDGSLTATNVSLIGSVDALTLSAESGFIGGWEIGSTDLSAEGTILDSFTGDVTIGSASSLQFPSGLGMAAIYALSADELMIEGDRIMIGDGTNEFIEFQNNNIVSDAIAGATTASAANVHIDANNQLMKSTSSIRYKQNVWPLSQVEAEKALLLRPVSYESRDNPGPRHYGFIAEEVAMVDQALVHWRSVDGVMVPDGVQYDRLTAHLLFLVQEMKEELWEIRSAISS